MMILREHRLIEKHAQAAGLGDIKIVWTRLGGGGAGANEALLSGAVHITSGGVAPLITLWARTKDTLQEVKAICAMNSMPGYLVTRNPNIKSVKDYTEKNRIAVPAIRVSNQALFLAMAAEKMFGAGKQDRFDSITVALPLPDGHAALLSGTEIDSQFSAPPYQYLALAQPGIHRVLSSYEIFGGPHTLNVIWTTRKFHDENPKTYAAFLGAYREATEILNGDKHAAAELYSSREQGENDTGHDIQAAKRPRDPLHAHTGKDARLGEIHVPGKPRQGGAGFVEGNVFSGNSQPDRKLTEPAQIESAGITP